MKKCSKCQVWKPLDQFRRSSSQHDGLQATCKECMRAYLKEYRQSESGKASQARSHARRRAKDPQKVAARAELQRAVMLGEVVRGPCEKCGTTEGVEGHHEDYSKPLDVRWLCRKDHRLEHADA